MSDETPSTENATNEKPSSVNPELAAALPAVPDNRFWRVSEVLDARNLTRKNLLKKNPTLLETIRNVLPSRNPDKLRLELRETIDGAVVRNVRSILEVKAQPSRVVRNVIVDVNGMQETEIVQSLTVEAQRILRELRAAETGKTRADTFKGDYR